MFGRSIALAAALSLAASPALAQTSAAPMSLQAADRAGASIEGESDLRGGNLFPPLMFVAIVIGGILLATGVIFDNDRPTSP
jgi:hypothetical protein